MPHFHDELPACINTMRAARGSAIAANTIASNCIRPPKSVRKYKKPSWIATMKAQTRRHSAARYQTRLMLSSIAPGQRPAKDDYSATTTSILYSLGDQPEY